MSNTEEAVAQKEENIPPKDPKLQKLPPEIVDIIVDLAKTSGREYYWKKINRSGSTRSAEVDKITYSESLINRCEGLMLKDDNRIKVCTSILKLFEELARYWGEYEENDSGDEKIEKVIKHTDIKKPFKDEIHNEFSNELYLGIESVGRSYIQYEQSTLRNRSDASSKIQAGLDYANYQCKKISSDAELLSIEFDTERGELIEESSDGVLRRGVSRLTMDEKKNTFDNLSSKKLFKEQIKNETKSDQSMHFSLTETLGSTKSTEFSLGFKIGTKASFKVGFANICDLNLGASFDISANVALKSSLHRSTTKTHLFILTARPGETVIGEATVKHCKMNVPLKMKYDLGGQIRECKGKWEGVAVSKAEYHTYYKPEKDQKTDQKQDPSP